MNAILRTVICIFLIAAPCSLRAQSVRLANSSTMEFNDPTYSVSFRFPSSWTFSGQTAFFSSPLITNPPDFDSDSIPLRGSVSAKKLAGVPSWPATTFDGVEFSYAVRSQTTPDDCRYLSLAASKPGTAVQDLVRNGQTFHHGGGSGVASGRGEDEEIDTVSVGTSCLLFDRTVHSLNRSPDDAPRAPRALTSQESARIQQPLRQIFESMKINRPSDSDQLPQLNLAKQFVDPRFDVRFRYPASWSFATVQQFYGAEGVLTPPPLNGAAVFTARAIVSAKGFAGDATLAGADFIFNVVPGQSMESCTGYLQQSRDLVHISTRPLDGIPFFYATTAAAGLCHQVKETIYLRQSGNECYFFDLAIHSICIPEGGRNATPAEIYAVRYQLQSILHSLVLGGSLHRP